MSVFGMFTWFFSFSMLLDWMVDHVMFFYIFYGFLSLNIWCNPLWRLLLIFWSALMEYSVLIFWISSFLRWIRFLCLLLWGLVVVLCSLPLCLSSLHLGLFFKPSPVVIRLVDFNVPCKIGSCVFGPDII